MSVNGVGKLVLLAKGIHKYCYFLRFSSYYVCH
jgi:hypothetical protein